MQRVLSDYLRGLSRSTTLGRQIGCGYEPLAEKTLTISLTRGSVACEGVEQMTIVLDLAPVYIREHAQLPGEGCRTVRGT